MTLILLFTFIVIGLNLIPFWLKREFPQVEKAIFRMLVLTTVIFLVMTVLLFNGYHLKGFYSNTIIGILFMVTTIMYFVLTKSTKRKLLTVVMLIPLVLLNLLTAYFGRTIYECKITDAHKIQVTTGGLLSCGELIHLTETAFFIFDKEILYESSLCLRKIERIETINFNHDVAEFLIHHNGERDAENPYRYKIENNNLW